MRATPNLFSVNNTILMTKRSKRRLQRKKERDLVKSEKSAEQLRIQRSVDRLWIEFMVRRMRSAVDPQPDDCEAVDPETKCNWLKEGF